MARVYLGLDETNPLKPIPCLHVNGQEMRMTWTELVGLTAEAEWLKSHAELGRKAYYKSLATKYKEDQNA